MDKLNRRDVLEKVGAASSIGLVGTLAAGRVEGKSEVNLSKKEKAKIDQVLKIVNREDLSEASKKEKLERYSSKIIEYALLPHSQTVSKDERAQANTKSESNLSVKSAPSKNMTTTVTNKNAMGDKLWKLTLTTWWTYTGTDIESVSWDISTDTWNSWSTDSTNVTDSTTENSYGGIGSWTVNGTGTFKSFIGTQQSCTITHVMYDHGDSDRYSCADP